MDDEYRTDEPALRHGHGDARGCHGDRSRGPVSRLDRKKLGALGSRLGVAAREIATIAEAVTILADLPDDQPLKDLDFPLKASMHCRGRDDLRPSPDAPDPDGWGLRR